jgi:branched-subunit amino acid transport protein
MDQKTVFLIILGMTLVTYLPRLLPVWILSSRSLPPLVVTWIGFVPVAVLSAMLLPALLVQDQHVDLGWHNYFLWAAIPCFLLVWKTRSYFGGILLGMLLVAGARLLFGG